MKVESTPSVAKYRFGIAYEHTQGHVTFASTLHEAVDADDEVVVEWVPLNHEPKDRLERLPPFSLNLTMLMALQARRGLKGGRATMDAALFHTQQTAMLSRRMMSHIPTVLSVDATPKNVDDLGVAYDHRLGSRLEEDLKRRLTAGIMGRAELVVPWSDWCRSSVIDDYGVAPERTKTIPAGINLARWAGEHQATPGPVQLLFVGAGFERKGGLVLLKALEGVRGEWELHAVTKTKGIRADPRIRVYDDLSPNDPRLVALFRQADVFVFPTLGDCSPFVILEAMAAGLPIVTTMVGAIPEMVGTDQPALLTQPGDEVALTNALQKLIDDEGLRRQLGRAARSRVEDRYDASKNARALLTEMKTLTKQRRDGGR